LIDKQLRLIIFVVFISILAMKWRLSGNLFADVEVEKLTIDNIQDALANKPKTDHERKYLKML
jgi:hypothetical protein